MECTTIRELIYDYMKGLAPQDDTDKVRGHLKHCSDCNEFYNDVEESLVMFGKIKELDPKTGSWEKLKNRLKRRRSMIAVLIIGAVAALLITLFLVAQSTGKPDQDVAYDDLGKGIKTNVEYVFGPGVMITIPNVGSISIMEENTRLSFENKTSLNLGSGAIYGRVLTSNVNSFLVKTKNGDLNIKGTSFLARILGNGETLVDVKEGQVEIKSKKTAKSIKNQTVKITNNGDIEEVKDVEQSLIVKLDIKKSIKLDNVITVNGSLENPSLLYPLYFDFLYAHIKFKLLSDAEYNHRFNLFLKHQRNDTKNVKIDASNPLKFSFDLDPAAFKQSNVYTAKFVYIVAGIKGAVRQINGEIESVEFEVHVK